MASESRDHSVRLWRTGEGRAVPELEEAATSDGWCVGLAFHPTQPLLATLGSHDRIVRVWGLDPEVALAGELPERPARPRAGRGEATRPRIMLR